MAVTYAMGPKRPHKPNAQVISALEAAAVQALGEGAGVTITSGMGQHGSPRHRQGHAADVQFTDPQGNLISLSDPRSRAVMEAAAASGFTAFGAGDEYMGANTFHLDMYPLDQYTSNMGRTWGSWGKSNADIFGGTPVAAAGGSATMRGGQGNDTLSTKEAPMGLLNMQEQPQTFGQRVKAAWQDGSLMDGIAFAANSLRRNPDESFGRMLLAKEAGRNKDAKDAKQQNKTVAWLRASGFGEWADAVESGALSAQQAIQFSMKEAEQSTDPRVQRSEILPDGTIVGVFNDGTPFVRAPSGEEITGDAAADAIRNAVEYGWDNEFGKNRARREGTNEGEINTGAAAAAVGEAGKQAVELSGEAFKAAKAVGGSTATIYEAIDALDRGGKSGAIDKFIPNITESSASLKNAMDRMGLDVISATTFGALSEGELRLAMETAVPRNLNEPELRDWLVRKAEANRKAQEMLLDAAVFFGTPGNTLQMWTTQNRGRMEIQPPPDAPPPPVVVPTQPGAQVQPGATDYDDFNSFKADPEVQAAAKKAGVTVEDMWRVLQEQGQ